MDVELTQDQLDLQEGVRKLCEGRFPMARLHAMEHTGLDRSLWKELADAGVFALRLPEDDGGVGLGWVEAVVVFEELGRALVPGPAVWTHLAAGRVDGAATGDAIVTGFEGPAKVVDHLADSDEVVILHGDGWLHVPASKLNGRSVARPVDPLTPVSVIDSGVVGGSGDRDAAAWRLGGAALTAALALGVAEAATDLAVGYAKERHQFDRPIGSFQAVKHLLADMLVRAEHARATVYAAGAYLDDPETGDATRAVSVAKVAAGEAAVRNGETCIQVHGGMGFTWEVDAHRYLKRAWVLDRSFGSADDHAALLAERLA